MEVTDAMRVAVLAEQCAREGHQYSYDRTLTGIGQPSGGLPVMVLGTDDGRAPHMYCFRCKRVWLVVEEGAADYDAAEALLIARLPANDALCEFLTRRRDSRAAPPPPSLSEISTEPDLAPPESA